MTVIGAVKKNKMVHVVFIRVLSASPRKGCICLQVFELDRFQTLVFVLCHVCSNNLSIKRNLRTQMQHLGTSVGILEAMIRM